jgi:hypothetical protein
LRRGDRRLNLRQEQMESLVSEIGYEGVSKSFRTSRLERELKVVQLSEISCSHIAII